ncbi:hypothetical protein RJ640_014112 [Escallonia rubra]|uniref:Uncharacterized protein n=1 Tax=Escallonia rubra TaxID=112253 RepID=A0AA88QIQ2_9ASTE|nr:hypothetical protein RJ640_014112 [Escallonia rubra]
MATPKTTLRRRNSISTSVVIPAKLTLPIKPHDHTSSFHATGTTGTTTSSSSSSSSTSSFQSFPSADFELISIRPTSYTSLKDLLPSAAAVQSPTAPATSQSGCEITIRNRLVKQAAWAYLQPMSTSPDSAGQGFLHRLWVRISGAGFFRFVDRVVTRAFDWMLRVIRVRTSR